MPDEEPYVLIDGEKHPVFSFPDRSLTPEQVARMRANTVGWRALLPKYDDEALTQTARWQAENCTVCHPSEPTYESMLIHHTLPELLRRFESVRAWHA